VGWTGRRELEGTLDGFVGPYMGSVWASAIRNREGNMKMGPHRDGRVNWSGFELN
jgi:hypothetical protein